MAVTAEDEARGVRLDARPALIDTAAVADGSASDAVRGLMAEAKATVDAELALAKVASRVIGAAVGRIAIWGVAALLLLFVALLAATAALILALAQPLGAVGAAGAVAGLLLLLAAFGAWRARANVLDLQRAAAMVVR